MWFNSFESKQTMTDIKEKYVNPFYEDTLKAYRDLKNSIDTAREEGII